MAAEGGGQAAGPRDLLTLQNLIKRDPVGYEDEFKQQFRHFEAMLGIFELNPSKDSRPFQDLVTFLAHVASCYPTATKEFPEQLMALLERNHAILDGKLRKTLVRALMLLRTKSALDPVVLLTLFFKLFRVKDKGLRSMLYEHIVSDIRNVNKKRRDNRLNAMLQNLLYTMLADRNRTAAKMSLDVMIELYRRGVWTDAKSVNVISNACLVKKHAKMKTAALKFFVSDNDLDVGDQSSDDGGGPALPTREQAMNAFQHASKTRSRKRRLEKALNRLNKSAATPKKPSLSEPNFPAIELLYDPQGFVERLFGQLKGSTDRFEVRLMIMDLISRCIAVHELILLNFYPFMQRYMQPHQQHITLILAIVAQSCHELVPPDAVEPVIQTLVYHFVTDRSSPDVMTVGLNTAREICRRCPLAMTATLLQDLVQYKTSKAKGVAMAARSLLGLFREINPALLIRRDRGKDAATAAVLPAPVYGRARNADTLADAHLLETMADVELPSSERDDQSDDGGSSGGWIDMPDYESDDNDDDDDDDGDGSVNGGASGAPGTHAKRQAAKAQAGAAGRETGDADSQYSWEEASDCAGEGDGEGEDETDDDGGWINVTDEAGEAGACGLSDGDGESEGEGEWAEVDDSAEGAESDGGEWHAVQADDDATSAASGSKRPAPTATGKRESASAIANRVVSQKLLTDEDFERIRRLRALQIARGEIPGSLPGAEMSGGKRKRRASMDVGDDGTVDPLVRSDAIEMYRKRAKMSASERRKSVEEGRSEKSAFGPARFTEGKKAGQSLSNAEKAKTKNFVMMKHKRSVLEKVKKSIRKHRALPGKRKHQKNGKAKGQA